MSTTFAILMLSGLLKASLLTFGVPWRLFEGLVTCKLYSLPPIVPRVESDCLETSWLNHIPDLHEQRFVMLGTQYKKRCDQAFQTGLTDVAC